MLISIQCDSDFITLNLTNWYENNFSSGNLLLE